ncbi:uncharacterized protein LOC130671800 [Microplitis mediator]|uniref:uncharacterized protein LOC130671800 n=1 Tax=Microplitis mediator TaxID=375433 RepID=UPI002554A813|nr:uncharacterized protein LOC130671800 [Microplitis mediator]
MNINKNLLTVVALLILFCQAFSYPDVRQNQNHEGVENAVTLHQIEEQTVDSNSQDNLKRPTRKVECPFSKSKSSRSSSSRVSGCPFSKHSSPQKTYAIVNTCEENGGTSNFVSQFSIIVEELFTRMKDLMDIMPLALDNIKNQAILRPGLTEVVEITSESCAKTQKDLSGFFDFFGNIFQSHKSESERYEYPDVDVSGCLETIKEHLLSFLGFLKPCMKHSEDETTQRLSKIEKYLELLVPSKFKSLSMPCMSSQKTIKYPSLFKKHTSSTINNCNDDVSLTNQIQTLRELSNFMNQFPGIINDVMTAVRMTTQMQGQTKEAYSNFKIHPSFPMPDSSCQQKIIPVQPQYSASNFDFSKIFEMISQSPLRNTQTANGMSTQVTSILPKTEHTKNFQLTSGISPSCSGQSIIDQVSMGMSSNGRNHNLESYLLTPSFNTHSSNTKTENTYTASLSNLDLLNVKVRLERSTVKTIFNDRNPQAGDIIIINITNDVYLVGVPSDDFGPIVFNYLYRGVSHKSPYSYHTVIWNLSSQDFACNPQILNEMVSHQIV